MNNGYYIIDLPDDADRFTSEQRLGSFQHYRYYFAFSLPAGALSNVQFEAFIQAAETDLSAAQGQFDEMLSQLRPQGGVMAEVLIDRLRMSSELIPIAAISNLFMRKP